MISLEYHRLNKNIVITRYNYCCWFPARVWVCVTTHVPKYLATASFIIRLMNLLMFSELRNRESKAQCWPN